MWRDILREMIPRITLGAITQSVLSLMFGYTICRAYQQGVMGTEAFIGVVGASIGFWFGRATSGGSNGHPTPPPPPARPVPPPPAAPVPPPPTGTPSTERP